MYIIVFWIQRTTLKQLPSRDKNNTVKIRNTKYELIELLSHSLKLLIDWQYKTLMLLISLYHKQYPFRKSLYISDITQFVIHLKTLYNKQLQKEIVAKQTEFIYQLCECSIFLQLMQQKLLWHDCLEHKKYSLYILSFYTEWWTFSSHRCLECYNVPDLNGGETRITPSPLTNNIWIDRLVLWNQTMT